MSKFYNELKKFTSDELIQIIHECEELLGMTPPSKYAEMISMSKKSVLNDIHAGKLKSIKIEERYFVVINDNI